MMRALFVIAAAALVVQTGSARWLNRDLQTPNSSTQIAQMLARDGVYGVESWHRLRGRGAPVPSAPLRAFHLPAEPLYLAAGFTVLPEGLWRYLHVPITAMFVVAVAASALVLFGRNAAILSGAVALADPYVFAHGPVWDDLFLAAAGEWAVFALLFAGASGALSDSGAPRWGLRALVAICAAIAAGARMQSQVLVVVLVALPFLLRALRPARDLATAAFAGAVVTVGAWTLRNVLVLGVIFPGTSHDGLTIFESNYQHARQALLETGTTEGLSETHLAPQFALVASLDEVASDRAYKAEAWRYMASHPADVATTAALKVVVSVTGADLSRPAFSPRNLLTVGSQLLLVIMALGGLWWIVRARPAQPIVHVFLVVFLINALLTIGMLMIGPPGMRYRIGLTGFFYIGAGVLLAQALDRLPHLRIGLNRPRPSQAI